MKHHWRLFLAALAGSAVVAAGFAIAIDRAAASQAPAPALRSVSRANLASSGVTLRPAGQAPYCGLQQAAAHNGWLPAGAAGCAISSDAAVAAAARTGPWNGLTGRMPVVETLLARVTSSGFQPAVKDHLAWLVVTQDAVMGGRFAICVMPAVAIGEPTSPVPVGGCQTPGTGTPLLTRVTLVDGYTGQVLGAFYPGMRPIQGVILPAVMGSSGSARPPATTPVVRASPAATPKMVPPLGTDASAP